MIQLEQTADGSYTLYVPEMDEHYHSVKGARTESEHVFIHTGLQRSSSRTPRVLEVGFGTGLNALLTLLEAEKMQRPVTYTTIEKYPVEPALWQQLDYAHTEREAGLFRDLHEAPWNTEVTLTPWFTLRKCRIDFLQGFYPNTPDIRYGTAQFDVIYFDAFAPEKQPEMWQPDVLAALQRSLSTGGILATYCAKGVIRRELEQVGFRVERLAGPPGGKREILRGIKKG